MRAASGVAPRVLNTQSLKTLIVIPVMYRKNAKVTRTMLNDGDCVLFPLKLRMKLILSLKYLWMVGGTEIQSPARDALE